MNKDVTQQVSATDSEKLSLILTTVQSLTVRFDNIDTRFNNMESRLDRIDSRVVRVEQTVNDMQPVLQKAVTDIGQLQESQVRLHQTVLQVEDGQRMIREGQERISTQVYALSRDVSDRFLVLSGATNAEVKDLQKRVTSLEANSNPPDPQT
jgi:chromosome segregation ATPase